MQMDEEVGKLASATPVMICEWKLGLDEGLLERVLAFHCPRR